MEHIKEYLLKTGWIKYTSCNFWKKNGIIIVNNANTFYIIKNNILLWVLSTTAFVDLVRKGVLDAEIENIYREAIAEEPSPRRINDEDRRQWIENDEGLYSWYRSSRMSMRQFIRSNRREIDEVIGKVTSGQKSAHYLEYEKPKGIMWNEPKKIKMPREVKQVMDAMVKDAIAAGFDAERVYAEFNHNTLEWVIGDNYDRITANLIYFDDPEGFNSGWYYRDSWTGETNRMKKGLQEALANAKVFFTG